MLTKLRDLVRESKVGQALLNHAMKAHLNHPCRFHYGPARCNWSGWIYFRLLVPVARYDYRDESAEYGI